MSLNYQKTIINGFEYEFVAAEVIDIDYFGEDPERLYSATCKMLGPYGSQATSDVIKARPLDANIKNLPIKGEVVFITKGPTAYNSAARPGTEYYYTNPISIQSSVHHNGIPGAYSFLDNFNKPTNETSRNDAEDGVYNKVQDRLQTTETIDPTFGERLDVYPIQPYPGDVIFEGRFGNSIRLGSTIDESRSYPIKPHWKSGLGAVGNPILIISNGTNPDPTKKKINEFIQEEIDKDDSTIWMTSGQAVKFTPASNFTPSIKNRSVDLHNKNEFAGNQILVSSDRIILNSKKQETAIFAAEGIGLSSMKGITLDAKDVIEMESGRINLGVNAVHPALLGDVTINWLADLCDLFSATLGHIAKQTHTSNTGPTGPPINAGAFRSVKSKVKKLRGKLKKLPSDLVFINEKAGGPKSDAAKEAKERNKNKEGYTKRPPSEQELESTNDVIPQTEKVIVDPTNVVTLTKKIDDVEKQKKKILEDLKSIKRNIDPLSEPVDVQNTPNQEQNDNDQDWTPESMIPGSKNSDYPNGITFKELGITNMETVDIDEYGTINYGGDIDLRNAKISGVEKLTEIPVPFGKIGGNFNVSGMGLTSLKNAPNSCINFDASANNLKNLIGGPDTVYNYSVDFTGITSLDGGPERVIESFSATNNNLKNLQGSPKSDMKSFNVSQNKQLTTLKGLPTDKTIENLFADDCKLTSQTIKKDTPKLKISKSVYLNSSNDTIVTNEMEKWIKKNWDASDDKSLRVYPGSLGIYPR